MIAKNNSLLCAAAISATIIIQACTPPAPAPNQSSATTPVRGITAGSDSTAIAAAPPNGASVAPAVGKSNFAQGESLAFEWSANGFEQLPARYTWSGTGKRDDVYQPNFSLSQAQTDDIIWSASCDGDGTVKTSIYLNPPDQMANNRATLRFETDTSTRTLAYPATFVESGQFSGFEITQNVNDPMFKDIKTGSWAYIQMGEGSKSVKLRVSLANASRSLGAFLPACAGASNAPTPQRQSAPVSTSSKSPAAAVTAQYTCDDGRSVSAVYVGNNTDNPSVRLTVDGKGLTLNQDISGSGARYESLRGLSVGKRLTWLTKGGTGALVETDRDDQNGTTEVVTSCEQGD